MGDAQDGRGMGILLIDARNAFTEINRTVMMWVIRHVWPSGSQLLPTSCTLDQS